MATIVTHRCDRCKNGMSLLSMYSLKNVFGNNRFDLCGTCYTLFVQFMKGK